MISLPSLMFKSRSCHCASLREGVRGNEVLMDLSWQWQFLFLEPKVTSQIPPFPSGTALEAAREQGSRQGEQIRLGYT